MNYMPFDHGEERACQIPHRRAGVGVNGSFESVLVERLAGLILRFGEAVAVRHQQVTGRQLRLGLLVGGRVEHAERDTAVESFSIDPSCRRRSGGVCPALT